MGRLFCFRPTKSSAILRREAELKKQNDIDYIQAWYIKHRIMRCVTSHTNIPQWVYQKLVPLEKDWYHLTDMLRSNEGVCEWSKEDDYIAVLDLNSERHKEYDQGLTFLTAARNAANQEESLSRYREAREKFEKALNSFLLLEDQDKVEKCSNWIDLCDKRTGLLQEPDKNQTKTGYAGYWVFALIGGGLAVAVAGVLWLKKTK